MIIIRIIPIRPTCGRHTAPTPGGYACGLLPQARFAKIGIPMAFGKDIFLGNAGPVWIENPIEYQMASDNSVLNVYSPCSHTPIDYPIPSAPAKMRTLSIVSYALIQLMQCTLYRTMRCRCARGGGERDA